MQIAQADLSAVLAQFNPGWSAESIPDLPSWRRAAWHELHTWIVSPPAPRAVLIFRSASDRQDHAVAAVGRRPSEGRYAGGQHPVCDIRPPAAQARRRATCPVLYPVRCRRTNLHLTNRTQADLVCGPVARSRRRKCCLAVLSDPRPHLSSDCRGHVQPELCASGVQQLAGHLRSQFGAPLEAARWSIPVY